MRVAVAALGLSLGLASCTEQAPSAASGNGYGPFADRPPLLTMGPPLGAAAPPVGETVLSGAIARAPAQLQAQVRRNLTSAAGEFAPGWTPPPSVDDVVAPLNVLEQHQWRVQLRGGESYAFIAACNDDCGDIDLYLTDAWGANIVADVMPDATPMVEVIPIADGAYTLRIQLKACADRPCYVGARLLRRPQT